MHPLKVLRHYVTGAIERGEAEAITEQPANPQGLSKPMRQWDANDWREECNYISRVTDKRGNVPEMNHDRATFLRYCTMQRDAAEAHGFHDAAQYIQHCIDDLS